MAQINNRQRCDSDPSGVLYVADGSHMGGGNVVVMNLIERLDRSRFEPSILVPQNGPLRVWAKARGVRCLVVPGNDASGRAAQYLRAIGIGVQMLRLGTRIIHATTPLCYRAAGLAASLVGAARVCHLGCPPGPGELEWCFQFGPDAVVGCYEGQVRDIAERMCRVRPLCRVVAVPNGVDTKRFAPMAPRHNAVARWRFGATHVITIIGNLSEVKGYPTFLRAAARIASEAPNCAFVAVGGETIAPGYRGELERRARDLGIGNRVHFLGWQENVVEILNAADVMVLPSLTEGLPLAVLEAMACGRPVVATPVGGTAEAMVDGVTGLFVAPHDAGQLASAVLRLLQNPDMACRLGEQGRRRVEAHFSLERVISQIEELYAKLLDREPHGVAFGQIA